MKAALPFLSDDMSLRSGLVSLIVLGTVVFTGARSAVGQGDTTLSSDSLTVGQVVERVLATHPAVKAARRSAEAANARVGQARSARWPRLNAVATYRRQDPVPEISVPGAASPSGPTGRSIRIQPNNLYDGRIEARQSLYDFGRTNARVEQAQAGQVTARRRIRVERSELTFEAVTAYFTTLLANARLRVQRDQMEQLQRTLEVVRQKQKAGTATEFEIQSTQTRLSAARSERSRFRSQRQSELAKLRRLLGLDPGAPIKLRGSLREVSASASGIQADTLQKRAVSRHPSVQVVRAQTEAARRAVQVATRSDAPQLALTAQGGIKNGYPTDINEPRLNESIGLSLQVPLFEGFVTDRQIEEAEAELAGAEARLTDVRRQVRSRIEQAESELRARRAQLESTARRVEQARTAAELARTRHKAGTITNLDLLQAETVLKEARLKRSEVRYQVIMGRYALRRAAGTLLPFNRSR